MCGLFFTDLFLLKNDVIFEYNPTGRYSNKKAKKEKSPRVSADPTPSPVGTRITAQCIYSSIPGLVFVKMHTYKHRVSVIYSFFVGYSSYGSETAFLT